MKLVREGQRKSEKVRESDTIYKDIFVKRELFEVDQNHIKLVREGQKKSKKVRENGTIYKDVQR